jgi:alpha-tubulin suppressor-like RCC1 family protein
MSRALVGLLALGGSACLADFPPYQCTRCFDASELDSGEKTDAGLKDSGIADAGPSDVGVSLRAVSLARGLADKHSCAIMEDRSLWCWGDNALGQLGLSTRSSVHPARVSGLEGVEQVTTGYDFTCALAAGRVYCFGNNMRGQIGANSSQTTFDEPTLLEGLENIVMIASGTGHTCALREDGEVFCWGDVFPSEPRRFAPLRLEGAPANISFIECGSQAVGMIADGNVWMVGENHAYVLGDGTTNNNVNPTLLPLPQRAVDLDIGDIHACATLEDGALMCWGQNGSGMVGNPNYQAASRPTRLTPHIADSSLITCGFRNTCLVRTSSGTTTSTVGQVQCFGENGYGTVGNSLTGDESRYLEPQNVPLKNPSQLELYWYHACALVEGTVYCWGSGGQGQIGNGTLSSVSHPVLVWR